MQRGLFEERCMQLVSGRFSWLSCSKAAFFSSFDTWRFPAAAGAAAAVVASSSPAAAAASAAACPLLLLNLLLLMLHSLPRHLLLRGFLLLSALPLLLLHFPFLCLPSLPRVRLILLLGSSSPPLPLLLLLHFLLLLPLLLFSNLRLRCRIPEKLCRVPLRLVKAACRGSHPRPLPLSFPWLCCSFFLSVFFAAYPSLSLPVDSSAAAATRWKTLCSHSHVHSAAELLNLFCCRTSAFSLSDAGAAAASPVSSPPAAATAAPAVAAGPAAVAAGHAAEGAALAQSPVALAAASILLCVGGAPLSPSAAAAVRPAVARLPQQKERPDTVQEQLLLQHDQQQLQHEQQQQQLQQQLSPLCRKLLHRSRSTNNRPRAAFSSRVGRKDDSHLSCGSCPSRHTNSSSSRCRVQWGSGGCRSDRSRACNRSSNSSRGDSKIRWGHGSNHRCCCRPAAFIRSWGTYTQLTHMHKFAKSCAGNSTLTDITAFAAAAATFPSVTVPVFAAAAVVRSPSLALPTAAAAADPTLRRVSARDIHCLFRAAAAAAHFLVSPCYPDSAAASAILTAAAPSRSLCRAHVGPAAAAEEKEGAEPKDLADAAAAAAQPNVAKTPAAAPSPAGTQPVTASAAANAAAGSAAAGSAAARSAATDTSHPEGRSRPQRDSKQQQTAHQQQTKKKDRQEEGQQQEQQRSRQQHAEEEQQQQKRKRHQEGHKQRRVGPEEQQEERQQQRNRQQGRQQPEGEDKQQHTKKKQQQRSTAAAAAAAAALQNDPAASAAGPPVNVSAARAAAAARGTPSAPAVPAAANTSAVAAAGVKEEAESVDSSRQRFSEKIVAPPGLAYPFPLPELEPSLFGEAASSSPQQQQHSGAANLPPFATFPSAAPAGAAADAAFAAAVAAGGSPPAAAGGGREHRQRPTAAAAAAQARLLRGRSYLQLLPFAAVAAAARERAARWTGGEEAQAAAAVFSKKRSSRIDAAELQQLLQELPKNPYLDWFFTPYATRDVEAFLAATDPTDVQQRFAAVYVHQKKHSALQRVTSSSDDALMLPALTDAEAALLQQKKIPRPIMRLYKLQRPRQPRQQQETQQQKQHEEEGQEKQQDCSILLKRKSILLPWKAGELCVSRDLIDAGGLGGFVRKLEVEGWAAVFSLSPSGTGGSSGRDSSSKADSRERELPLSKEAEERRQERRAAAAAQERLERATWLQLRAWQQELQQQQQEEEEEQAEKEEAAVLPQQQQQQKREPRLLHVKGRGEEGGEGPTEVQQQQRLQQQERHPQKDAGDIQPQAGEQEQQQQGASTAAAGGEGRKEMTTARVHAAAAALLRRQQLRELQLPAAVQILASRFMHVTPNHPPLPPTEADAALQLLQRALGDMQPFLLHRIHAALQADKQLEPLLRLLQERREAAAAAGQLPAARASTPLELTPDLVQELEEAAEEHAIVAAAAASVNQRLDAAAARHQQQQQELAQRETKGRGEKEEEDEGRGEEEEAAAGRRMRRRGMLEAAAGGVGSAAYAAVVELLQEEMEKEKRKLHSAAFERLMQDMHRNVEKARNERVELLGKQQQQLVAEQQQQQHAQQQQQLEARHQLLRERLQDLTMEIGKLQQQEQREEGGSSQQQQALTKRQQQQLQELRKRRQQQRLLQQEIAAVVQKQQQKETDDEEEEELLSGAAGEAAVERLKKLSQQLETASAAAAAAAGPRRLTMLHEEERRPMQAAAAEAGEGGGTTEEEEGERGTPLAQAAAVGSSDSSSNSNSGAGTSSSNLSSSNNVSNSSSMSSSSDVSSSLREDVFDAFERLVAEEWRAHWGGQSAVSDSSFSSSSSPFSSSRLSGFVLRASPGQLVEGRVVKVSRSVAYVHVAYKCEGELRVEEAFLEDEKIPAAGLKQLFRVGDHIFAEVVKAGDAELLLSLRTLRRVAAWEKLLELQQQTDHVLPATVTHVYPKGGLGVTVLGLRGFLPQSQMSSSLQQRSNTRAKQQLLLGQQLPVALLQADIEEQKLLVSHRLVAVRQQMKQQRLDQVVDGHVVSVHPFGAFIQFGECRGLLHISEISAGRVEAVDQVLSVGSPVRALVLHYDQPTGKIALTTKALERYPGEMLREPHTVYEWAVRTAQEQAERKKQDKEARQRAARQLVAALGLDPAYASAEAHAQQDPLQRQQQQLTFDASTFNHSGKSHTATTGPSANGNPVFHDSREKTSLWGSVNKDGSRLMTLLTQKILQKEDERRLGGPGGSRNHEIYDDGPSPTDLLRDQRQRVIAAARASAMELKGAWHVPSVFEAEWEETEWTFD